MVPRLRSLKSHPRVHVLFGSFLSVYEEQVGAVPQANRRNPKYDRVRLWANFRERNSQTSDRHGNCQFVNLCVSVDESGWDTNWSQHISIKLAKKPKIKAVSGVLS